MPDLHDDLKAQATLVVDRVRSSGANVQEADEIAVAASLIPDLVDRLELGPYLGSMSLPDGRGDATIKPQYVLRFAPGEWDGGPTGEVIVKQYGKQRPGEGGLQNYVSEHGGPTVPTLAFGDEPASWLLMQNMPGHDLTHDLTSFADVYRRTKQVAALSQRIAEAGPTEMLPGGRDLVAGISIHLDVCVPHLLAHGYEIPGGADAWRPRAHEAYRAGNPMPLHGDLTGSNIRVLPDGATEPLLAFDAAYVVGDPSFEMARWTTRMAKPQDLHLLMSAWLEGVGAASFDPQVVYGNVANELLLRASEQEIVKTERGLPWEQRDEKTLTLLRAYGEAVERSLDGRTSFEGLSVPVRHGVSRTYALVGPAVAVRSASPAPKPATL